MPWTIERKHDHVAVVTMNTNKVNAQNPAFFGDLHAAFDRLEAEFSDRAVVLTGTGAVFSAGLDDAGFAEPFAKRSDTARLGRAVADESDDRHRRLLRARRERPRRRAAEQRYEGAPVHSIISSLGCLVLVMGRCEASSS
jgi:enoyl-CoA hydratase/carnithine racemase